MSRALLAAVLGLCTLALGPAQRGNAGPADCDEPSGTILPWPTWTVTGTVQPFEVDVYRVRTTLPAQEESRDAPPDVKPVLINFASVGDAFAHINMITSTNPCTMQSQNLLPFIGSCAIPDTFPVCQGNSVALLGRDTWIEVWGDPRASGPADYVLTAAAPLHHDV